MRELYKLKIINRSWQQFQLLSNTELRRKIMTDWSVNVI